nr:carbonic anhydrase 9 [Anolis sagrei ordinatus]
MLGAGLLLVLLALSLGPSPPFLAFSDADSGGSSREEEEKEDPHSGPPHHGDPHHWSYTDKANWSSAFPFCGGHLQSPIDIETSAAIFSPQLTPILLSGYDLPSKMRELAMFNSGHWVVLDLPRNLSVSGGGFPFPYQAAQLHLHWGSQPGLGGSEHTVDGHRFAGELHVVHYDSRFGSIKEAAKEPGGLAVLAAFLENMLLLKIGGEETLLGGFDVAQLLPTNLGRYFRYNGSLTTPPCFQTVNWTIFNQTLRLSPQQILVLEDTLRGDGDHPLHGNFRLPQDLYGRTVLASFSEGHSSRRAPLPGNGAPPSSPETPKKPPEEEGDGVASGQGKHPFSAQTPTPFGAFLVAHCHWQLEEGMASKPTALRKMHQEETLAQRRLRTEVPAFILIHMMQSYVHVFVLRYLMQAHLLVAPGACFVTLTHLGGSAPEETPGEEEGHSMAPGEDGGQPRSPPEGTSGADPVPAPPEGGSNRASGSGTAQQTESGIQAGGVLAILFGVLFGLTALAFFLYVRKHRKQNCRLAAQSGKPSVIYTPAAKTEENTV